jgi:hypothetical protein
VQYDQQDDACDEDKEGNQEMAIGDDDSGFLGEAQSTLHAERKALKIRQR